MYGRIVELNGLHGFAALSVVSRIIGEAAGGFRHLQIGWLGVNTFFVLPGFLVGAIIFDQLHEADSSSPLRWKNSSIFCCRW